MPLATMVASRQDPKIAVQQYFASYKMLCWQCVLSKPWPGNLDRWLALHARAHSLSIHSVWVGAGLQGLNVASSRTRTRKVIGCQWATVQKGPKYFVSYIFSMYCILSICYIYCILHIVHTLHIFHILHILYIVHIVYVHELPVHT